MEVERPLPPKGDGMDVDAGCGGASTGPSHGASPAEDAAGGDLYTRLKQLQRQLELTEIQASAGGGG